MLNSLTNLAMRYQPPNFPGGIAAAIATTLTLLTTAPALADEAESRIATSHGISHFGDLKYSADFTHLDYVNPDAPKGGALSTWGYGTFDSLNPFVVMGEYENFVGVMFESLMARAYDEADSYYGLLAESVSYPEPNREWIEFKIRPEARFSDGSIVTAEDVVFSFEMLSTKGSPRFSIPYRDVESVEALEMNRVRFNFKPDASVRSLSVEVATMPVFAKSHFSDRDFAQSSLDPMLASGPYVVESMKPGHSIIYRKNQDYWGESLPYNTGQNNFERIVIEYYVDYTSAFEGFKGGDYDFRKEYYSVLWKTAYVFPEVQDGLIAIDEIPDLTPAGAQGFFINLRRPHFQDPRVREAIGKAFNFEWSNQTLFHGSYRRTDSFWENSTLQAEGLPTPAELALLKPLEDILPAVVFTEPAFVPPLSNPDRLADRDNLAAAARLLDDAGWTLVDGVRRNSDGEALAFEIISDSPGFDRIITPFIENLERLGIQAQMRRVDNAQKTRLEDEFDFDITTRRYSFGLTPGVGIRSAFGSASASSFGSYNISGVDNAGVDALLDAIEGATSRAELTAAVKSLDRVLRALHIWVPQYYGAVHRVAFRKKYSRPENQAPYQLGEMATWWYDSEKAEKHGLLE
ncbi:MAG: extracellular solute-binding protein [Rhodobacteraceae bacterium]|nr:extracellular solute-binding protein [Paracoccaceae bacterium]